MVDVTEQMNEFSREAVQSASRLSKLSLQSAEKILALQLRFAKSSLDESTKAARSLAGAHDVQEFLALRAKAAESAMEAFMAYSRSLYEVASEAQGELSRIAEERMSGLQKAVAESVDLATRNAPAGSDVAVAALKSSMAAATNAFDSFSKAARQAASLTDAGVRAAARPKTKTKTKTRK